jgi:hypothetical protein
MLYLAETASYNEVGYNEFGREENATHPSVFSSRGHQQYSHEQFEDFESRSIRHDDDHLNNLPNQQAYDEYSQFPRYSYPRPSKEQY